MNLVELAFEITPADHLAFNRHFVRVGEFYLRQMRKNRVMIAILPLAMCAAILLGTRDPFFSVAVAAVSGLISLWFWFTWPTQWEKQVLKQAQAMLALENQSVLFGPRRYRLDETGVGFSSPDSMGRVSWRAISRVTADEAGIYLHLSQNQAHILPRRAFADETTFQAAVAFATQRCESMR